MYETLVEGRLGGKPVERVFDHGSITVLAATEARQGMRTCDDAALTSGPGMHRYGWSVIMIQRAVMAIHPVDRVFAYLADFTNAPEWDSGTVSCTMLSGDGGVGTTYANRSKFMGLQTELTYELIELDPDRLIVLRGENSTVISTDHMLIQSAAGGTEVLYTAEFEFKGVARFLEPLLRIPLEKLGDDAEKTLALALGKL